MMIAPWLLHDSEVALWPAWSDGIPYYGPGSGRGRPEPLLSCKSNLRITQTVKSAGASGMNWRGGEKAGEVEWGLSIEFISGAMADEWGRMMSRMEPGGYRILTVRFFDGTSGQWTLYSFFYVTPQSDVESPVSEIMGRTVELKSTWMQESVGSSSLPPMEPVVMGEVDWICGTQRITALQYNPITETWVSLLRNQTGDGTRYVTLTPMSAAANDDVVLTMLLPRLEDAPVTAPALPNQRIKWQNTMVLRIGSHLSANHPGMTLRGGHQLQALGIAEPLIKVPQDRMLDEPVVVFRYLRRIYATIGHGVLSVPRLIENAAPPVTRDPAFRIAVPGPANPTTGQAGLVLLPNGAWLDGTLVIHP